MSYWLCFLTLLVAVDPIGVLPMFLALTHDCTPQQRRDVIVQSVVTALIVALGFLFLGQWVLGLLGTTISDFMVAGGAVLFVFALGDMVGAGKEPAAIDRQSVGAVPLGVPLTVGPAVLTTILLLAGRYGPLPTVVAVVANVVLVGLVFGLSQPIVRVLGTTGIRTVSKVVALVMAAFAVTMIRMGLMKIIQEWKV